MLKTRIYPVIAYPLALTSFTAMQCKRISVILEDTILLTLRISQKMKKAVVMHHWNLGTLAFLVSGTCRTRKASST